MCLEALNQTCEVVQLWVRSWFIGQQQSSLVCQCVRPHGAVTNPTSISELYSTSCMCVFVYAWGREDWIKRLSESDPATTDLNRVKTSFTHFHIFQWQPYPASGAGAYTVDIIPLFFCYCILPDCDPSDPVWAEADCAASSKSLEMQTRI